MNDEVNRLANDLAGDWHARAEKAERDVTVWKTRLVEETARLRDINRGLAGEAERLRAYLRDIAEMDPADGHAQQMHAADALAAVAADASPRLEDTK